METVLITGANGFVGFYLTRHLLRKDYRVVATGQGANRLPYAQANFECHTMDFTNPSDVAEVFRATQPAIVVHGGALTKPDDCALNPDAAVTVNVEGTRNMLLAAAGVNAYFLYLSTDFVFAGNQDTYAENDRPQPVNFYGETKAAAEQLVQQYAGTWAIARPILLYGVPQTGKQNILTMVASALKEGRMLKLFTDQQRLPTYIEDFTWGLEQMIAKQAAGIYHFCGTDALSPFDMGIRVAHYLGYDKSLIATATAADFHQPAARPPRTMFRLEKVIKEFGYRPTSFAEGMRKTLEGWKR
ncbi:dTDP-4-dehydrorhamnose reductase [Cnuella takakiae]|uniref:dTDP-4-dehydrorhamnose reductase n=1 Tax=Cnuella takakiae TaxID=1302690 RepID=A0A1M4VEJ1_9BACT|nr:SDR family oxidoreductase [Cnuella takakiae]OLY92620.1 hypothetical protein BUE76_12510 [Cnuella takakiae]SHE67414.1 dTDP-4-dehydrorhamnose reductase [Cnuella takakiae]